MTVMEPKGDLMHLEFRIPSRGLIGLRTQMVNATQGEAVMAHRFDAYEPWKGDIAGRTKGTMIANATGTTVAFSINKLQDRGIFFVPSGVEIYEGQIVGEHSRSNDLVINVTQTKQLTNMRASGSDDKVKIIPPMSFTLEEYMEYVEDDEFLEVTPISMRLRKINLTESDRKRAANPALAGMTF